MLQENLKLIEPNETFESDYYNFIQEFKDLNEELIPFVLRYENKDFKSLIKLIKGFSKGLNLPNGFVPHTTYWLINQKNKILGVINIRHKLNKKLEHFGGIIGYGVRPSERQKGYATEILRLGLQKTQKMGFKKVLITCKKTNIASAKTIIKNGGKLDTEVIFEDEIFQRYWIYNNFD